jgi:hypothetical protein
MLEKNKQEISDVSDSFVQQANGDIHNYGLGYNDVKAICHDVVRQELAIVTREASETLNREISSFEERFIEKLQQLEDPKVIEKLGTPKLQLILHSTMKEYATSNNIETKEELIDLLIERLKADENSSEIFLIDTAIEILPKINKSQCYFLGALTSRKQNVVDIISKSSTARGFLEKQAKLYEDIDRITNLDIQYLKQINCCTNIIGQSPYYDITKTYRKEFDLLFRHPCSVEDYCRYIDDDNAYRMQTIQEYEKKLKQKQKGKEEYDRLYKKYEAYINSGQKDADYLKIEKRLDELSGIHRAYDAVKRDYNEFLQNNTENILPNNVPLVYKDEDSNRYYLYFCSEKGLKNECKINMPNRYKILIETLFLRFTNYDIEQYLIALNNNWRKAIEVLKRSEMLNIDLTPIGAYIGRRIIARVTGVPTRSIEQFYNE